MKLDLDNNDIMLLRQQNIRYAKDFEYTEDQVFKLLDLVHDAEICFAQNESGCKANAYAKLADKIQAQI